MSEIYIPISSVSAVAGRNKWCSQKRVWANIISRYYTEFHEELMSNYSLESTCRSILSNKKIVYYPFEICVDKVKKLGLDVGNVKKFTSYKTYMKES